MRWSGCGAARMLPGTISVRAKRAAEKGKPGGPIESQSLMLGGGTRSEEGVSGLRGLSVGRRRVYSASKTNEARRPLRDLLWSTGTVYSLLGISGDADGQAAGGHID